MIKNTILKVLLAVLAGLLVLCFILVNRVKEQKKELERTGNNIEALTGEVSTFKTKSGNDASTIQALQLKTGELQKYNKELYDKVKDLKSKEKSLESALAIKAELVIQEKAVTVTDTVFNTRKAEYYDGWNRILCTAGKDSTTFSLTSIDSIYILNEVRQRKFWFIKLGKPKIQTVVSNVNKKSALRPYINVRYVK